MKIGSLHVWTVWHPAPNPETYEAHWRILKANKNKVYWGVINKKNDPNKDEFSHYLEDLKSQLEKREHTYIFIVPEDHSRYLGGEITKIKTGVEFFDWRESAKVPEYYGKFDPDKTDYTINYWFLLSSFGWLDHLQYGSYVKPIHDYKRSKYGESGRPYPSVCEYLGTKKIQELFVTHSERMRVENASLQHSDNYRSVNYKGKEYALSPFQAAALQFLHERYISGLPNVSQHEILEEIGSKSKHLKDLFKGSPLWKNLIIKGQRKDTFRLNF
jgi:hypothetical protein